MLQVCSKLSTYRIGCLLLFLWATFLHPPSGQSQVTQGSISGTVTDPNAGVVPNCKVTVHSVSTGEERIVNTTANGSYNVPSLDPGEFLVSAEVTGFKTTTRKATVSLAEAVTVDFSLVIGDVKEVVEATDVLAPVAVEKDSHEISNTVTVDQLQSLPANGRNFLSLVALGPGAQPGSDEGTGNGSSSFYGVLNKDIVLSGQSIGRTEVLQDGVTNLTLMTQTANILPSIESISEARVESNGMSARFAQPGVINVISKSGSNGIHGTGYDFLENDVLAAKYFFATTKSPLRSNQFGANAGAPIVKNKLFAFFDYAGQRQSSATTKNVRVPTALERQGIFTGSSTKVYDPATYNAKTGAIAMFPNNVIPADRINPYSAAYLNYYPLPTKSIVNGNNFTANLPTTTVYDQFLGKVDYNISLKDTLTGEIQQADAPVLTPSINPNYFGIQNTNTGVNASIQETHVISPDLLNTARAGYNRSVLFRTQQAAGTQNFAALFGLQNVRAGADQSAPPLVTISGLGTGLGDANSPQGAVQNLFQYADEVNWTMGRHHIFFGADLKRYQFDGNWTVGNNGSYTFNGQYSSNHKSGSALVLGPGLADFLLGYPSSGTLSQGASQGSFREYDVAGYIQDDWKVLPHLTLNLGLRYEYHEPAQDRFGHASTYLYYLNMNSPGTWNSNYLDFAPRVGLAWAIDSKTVIRSGFGIYYNSTPYNYLQFDLTHPPNYYQQAPTEVIATPVPWQNIFSANPQTSSSQPFTLGKVMKDPYVEQWNLNIQRAITSKMLFTIGYVGNASHHQSIRFNPNQATPSDNPALAANQTAAAINSRRPYKNIGDVYAQFNIANANYNALQVHLRYIFSKGLSFQGSYAWSKALDIEDSDQVSAILTGQNLGLSYGPANFNRTHVFRFNSVYELPIGAGKPFLGHLGWFSKQVLGGWQATGIYTFGSGLPFSATASNLAYIGGVNGAFANRSCSGSLPNPSVDGWFDTDCFTQPAVGQLGNAGRNSLRGPNQNNFDIAGFKRFPFTEQRWLEFRAEFFNAFNHPQFYFPTYQAVSNSQFGKPTSASAARTIQLSLKLVF